MGQLSNKCAFTFWHKLDADDLVVCVNHMHLEALLATLREVSHEYELRINPKKCAVLAVRGHNRITA